MKRVITAALLLACISAARAEELKKPEELLVEFVAATGSLDFAKVVDSVHPFALTSFKVYTLRIVNAAAKDFSEDAVKSAFHGLRSLSDLDAMREKDFWVYVMGSIYSIYPEFDGAKSIEVVGNVVAGDFTHVLYTQDADLKSTDAIEGLRSPRTFTFRKDGERWCYWSIQLSGVERYVQWCAKRQQVLSAKADSGQGGADQHAATPKSKPQGHEKPKPKAEERPR